MDVYKLLDNPDYVWGITAVIVVLGIIFAWKKLKGLAQWVVIVIAVLLMCGVSLKTIYTEGSMFSNWLWGKAKAGVTKVINEHMIPDKLVGTKVRVNQEGVLEVLVGEDIWTPLKGSKITTENGKMYVNGHLVKDKDLQALIEKVK